MSNPPWGDTGINKWSHIFLFWHPKCHFLALEAGIFSWPKRSRPMGSLKRTLISLLIIWQKSVLLLGVLALVIALLLLRHNLCYTILNLHHHSCILTNPVSFLWYPHLSAEGELVAFERRRGDVARVQAATNQVDDHFDLHMIVIMIILLIISILMIMISIKVVRVEPAKN